MRLSASRALPEYFPSSDPQLFACTVMRVGTCRGDANDRSWREGHLMQVMTCARTPAPQSSKRHRISRTCIGHRHHTGWITLAVARFFQNCFRLSSAPNSVLNTVESVSRISPARGPLGGIHTNELNSRLPASVNGCGFDMSIG